MPRWVVWSDEEEKALKRMVEMNIPLYKMTKVLKGRTISAIDAKLRRMGYQIPKECPEVDWSALEEIAI